MMGEVVQLFQKNKQPVSSSAHKLQVFKEGLNAGVVMVTLDATCEGVSVPSHFSGSTCLSFNYSYDYHLPDFAFDEDGVSATLSFDEGFFHCLVPWVSVYRIGDQVWPEDFP